MGEEILVVYKKNADATDTANLTTVTSVSALVVLAHYIKLVRDSHDYAASASRGKWLEVGRPPERVSIVLGGEDSVMEAKNGMPVRFCFASRPAPNRSSSSRHVLDHDRVGAQSVLSNGLLKDPDENIASSACRERDDDRYLFLRKLVLRVTFASNPK